jgi:TRAP-type mannitol/chloroaromatic compound transport system substrate-binding protein
MRIPGLGAQVMEQLGVIPQSLPGGEIYQALERGAIDATEWVGPYDDEKLGLQRVAKVYHYPGWWEPQTSISIYINRTAYEGLPSAYKEALQSASDEVNALTLSAYDAQNPKALTRLVAEGVQPTPFPDDVMQAASRTSREMLDDAAAGADAHYRDLLQSYRAFQDESARWFATAERTMADFTPRAA